MKFKKDTKLSNNPLNLAALCSATKQPTAITREEKPFWDDEHISKGMLEAHLNPTLDSASRNHSTIDKTVSWLANYLKREGSNNLLDLGCGPGLYCSRFLQHGFSVVGMDFSKRSINYAKKYAAENALDIDYIYQNYQTLDYQQCFDAISLIYCDFGVLVKEDRDNLLERIHAALKPNGVFVFDVPTKLVKLKQCTNYWYVAESGFWRPTPHLALTQMFYYEEENVFLDLYTIVDENGNISTYKVWEHCYTKESISELLEKHGFQVQEVWSDLTGAPYADSTELLGIVAKKI